MSLRNNHESPQRYPSLPTTQQGYGGVNLSPFPMAPNLRQVFQDRRGSGLVEPTEYRRPFEEGRSVNHHGLPSGRMMPITRPAQIIIVNNNNMDAGITRPMFIPHHLHPIFGPGQHENNNNHESKLTEQEQDVVMKKLKRQIYNPVAKTLARRVSLYYRDLNHVHGDKSNDKHRDEDGKSCAICLEDFEPNNEVMLTPCDHMFHEECIVPWVKNHGQCPICRSTLCERIRENGSVLSNNNNNNVPRNRPTNIDELFRSELMLLF